MQPRQTLSLSHCCQIEQLTASCFDSAQHDSDKALSSPFPIKVPLKWPLGRQPEWIRRRAARFRRAKFKGAVKSPYLTGNFHDARGFSLPRHPNRQVRRPDDTRRLALITNEIDVVCQDRKGPDLQLTGDCDARFRRARNDSGKKGRGSI